MSDIKEYTKGSLHPKHLFWTLRYKLLFARNNPDYFYPAGIWVFCGPQGSGKTLSMVQTLKRMLKEYPKAMVVSNLQIYGLDVPIIPFESYEQLLNLSNDVNGIIFVLDEIHVLWNSLESKDIPISEMATFCQMRKDRRVILGTSQVYSRIAKPIREQLQYVIECRNFAGVLQWNEVLDPAYCQEEGGQLVADKICTRLWFHTPALYASYDTLFKITKAKRLEEPQKGKKYGKGSN